MKLTKTLMLAGLAAVLTIGLNSANAQGFGGGQGGGRGNFGGGQGGGPGNFDPAQMRQRMLDNYRQQLDVKEDADWKVLEAQITKVMEARQAANTGGRGGMGMMRPPRNNNGDNADQPQRQRRGGMGNQTPNPAAEALQKAIDSKAPSAEIQTKLAAYRADVTAKQAKLKQAQDDLKKLLTPTQEAIAVLDGLLN